MPLTEQTKKRIGLVIAIIVVIAGALFMVFAFFLNKGTLIIKGKAPFLVSMGNIKNFACTEDICKSVIAPGQYQITVIKEGYRQVQMTVNVPIGGETVEAVDFVILPSLKLIENEDIRKLFEAKKIEGEDLPTEGLSFEENYVVYIERDKDTHRQTLYVRGIQAGKAGEKTAITSFVRDLKSYLIVPSIEKNNKVAVVDVANSASTLYIVDISAKTRESVLTYPLITGVKWLPGTDGFLLSARENGSVYDSVFIYDPQTKKAAKLGLQTSLGNIVPVNKDRFIAATVQYIDSRDALAAQEGKLVTLSEGEATPSVLGSINLLSAQALALSFIDYSVPMHEGRLLKAAPDLPLPAEGKISPTGKSVYFLIEGKVYELTFTD